MATQQQPAITEPATLDKKQMQLICKGLELLKAQQERRLKAEDDSDMKGLFVKNIMEITRLLNAMEETKGKI